ncbi:hypothetical protein STCU_10893 [Strigomonas culicis]|uniref:Uncharacterized protein n=1 Tax=Strigomonas culicis TaxID=28005 RepID=S9TFV3_9TRYP|nr:hypothetical protein STCU_10893 [Strigomonas culicis]|eukprot:EPY16952.1 hypothetical protein STCU_10893 [Strigomonas culicis]
MTSSHDIYTSACARLQVHPNSALLNVFAVLRHEVPDGAADRDGAAGLLQEMALDRNLLGPRGLQALLPVLSFNRQTLHTLRLNGNRLRNESAYALRHLLYTSFPALRVVDLSDNPFTYRAAKCLAEMAEGLPPLGAAAAPPPRGASSASAPLIVRLREGLAHVGHDNHIAEVVLARTLLSARQQACVEQRIRDAIRRREERQARWLDGPPIAAHGTALATAASRSQDQSADDTVQHSGFDSFASRLTDDETPKQRRDGAAALPTYSGGTVGAPPFPDILSTTAAPGARGPPSVPSAPPSAPPVPPIALRSDVQTGAESGNATDEEEEEEEEASEEESSGEETPQGSHILQTVTFTEGHYAQHHPRPVHSEEDAYENVFEIE